MLVRHLIVECLKLRRSLAMSLCLAAPALVVALQALVALNRAPGMPVTAFVMSATMLWGIGMLPLAVTALSVLLAQIEHGSGGWRHLLALPGARPSLFLAKALVMLLLIVGMHAALLALLVVTVATADALQPALLTGGWDLPIAIGRLARFCAAGFLFAMLQLWVALRFRSFVPPLVFGIGGTMSALVAGPAAKGIYDPWLLPFNAVMSPDRADIALAAGAIGGAVVLMLMAIDLSYREACRLARRRL